MGDRQLHVYSACDGSGATVIWQPGWYTEAWCTASRDLYDQQASTGAVNPPMSVYANDPACSAFLGAAAEQSSGTFPAMTTTASDVTAIVTGASSGSLTRSKMTASRTAFPSPSRTPSITASDPRNTSPPTPFAAAVTDPSTITTCSGHGMDYQAWGAVASGVLGIVLGLMVWCLWWMLKKKRNLVGVYTPREWFVGNGPRTLTSRKEFWTTLKFPSFNWLTAAPPHMVQSVSETTLVSVALLAVFKILAWSSIAIVALAFPLFIVLQPCIELTGPKSPYGGRLGTLTDLSILRLLNALDPDPAYFIPKPGQRPGQSSRDLSSTVRPATNTARNRLIVLVALCAGIIFLPSILYLARGIRSLIAFQTHWRKEVCEGEEMAFLPWKKNLRYGAPTTAMTEQEVRRLASELRLWDDGQSADAEENDERAKRRTTIRSVFAVPDTTDLRTLLDKRSKVLEKLEVAETEYIRFFKANFPQPEKPATSQLQDNGTLQIVREAVDRSMGILSPEQRRRLSSSNMQKRPRSAEDADPTTVGYILPRNYYKINDLPTIPSRSPDNTRASSTNSRQIRGRQPTLHEEVQGGITGSQFREVYRDSLMGDGRLPPVGTPLAIKQGKFSVRRPNSAETEKALPPPPTESALTEAFVTAIDDDPSSPRASSIGQGNGTRRSRITFVTQQTEGSLASSEYPRMTSTSLPSEALLPIPILEQPVHPRSQVPNQPPIRALSGVSPEDIGENYAEIREHRARLLDLNGQVAETQAITYEYMMVGKKVLGYMVIGRSVTKIPGSIPITGLSRDDVRWNNLARVKKNSSMSFWFLWLLSTIFAAICMIPFIGLANSTAPGFSHYLGFLKPIARSDGLGSGIVQAIVPAVGIALILWGLQRTIDVVSRHDISKTARQYRTMKAMCFSSVLLAMWLVAASALIFAVQSLDDGVQVTRFVGDGAVYSCWWLFCLLLNLAVFIPGCFMLRAGAAYSRSRLHRKVETPRQRFRAFFPSRVALSTLVATCVFFISLSFPLFPLFPLMTLPALLFLGLLFLACRYLATYTDLNHHGSSGGRLAIGMLRILGWALCLQPLLLGLVLLSRREYRIGGASAGVAVAGLIMFEVLVRTKDRPRRLPREDRERLQSFAERLKTQSVELVDDGSDEPDLPASENIRRRSNQTIFELMSDLLIPSDRRRSRGPLPLQTEHIDDLLDPYRANLAHPDIHRNAHELPPLSLRTLDGFDMVRYQAEHTMYPSELIMPAPAVWLPDDNVDIGKQEVEDLMRFYRLPAMLDAVRS